MALNLKLDTNDIPSLLQILGLGGLSRQAAQDDSGNDFAASGGVATHPAYGGGGDGAVQRPDINYSEAHANSMPDNTSTPPFVAPPVDPSLGGAGDPTAQPRSLMDVFAGSPAAPNTQPINPGQGQVLPPESKTKLGQLRDFLNPPAPVPQNFEGMPIGDYQPPSPSVPDAGPIAPRSLMSILSGAPAPTVAPPNTFSQNHPKLAKFLKAADEFALTAGPGIGAPTFGQGFEASLESAQRRKAYALQNADTAAKTAHTQAETQAIQNPQGKPTAAQLEFDKAGNIIGYRDPKGNLIGPKNPNLPQDVRDMMDAAEQRTTSPTTPEGQVMSYLVKSGKTPAQAYQAIQDAKQNSKPDTQAQNKQQFQAILGKLAAENGNAIDSAAFSDPRKLATTIQGARTLTPEEKQSAQAYLLSNTTPSNTILAGDLRAGSYGATRQYSILDTKNGNRPGYVSADELNRANRDEPGRYLASGPGATALNKENLMEDIRGGIQQVRDALNNPNMPDFTAKQKVKIAVAMRERDPRSAVSSLITAGDLGTVTPEQEDYLIAHSILAEQAMAMRTVLGAGQGSQDLRAAITNTFPGPTTPSKAYGLKQLDAFEKTVDRLERGIPNVPLKDMRSGGNQGGNNSNSLAGPIQQGERTSSGPGGHTVVLRSGKWVDPSNGIEVK